jgi:hypothetical protein
VIEKSIRTSAIKILTVLSLCSQVLNVYELQLPQKWDELLAMNYKKPYLDLQTQLAKL